MRNDRLFIGLMLAPALLILAAFYGYPMVENVRISFTDLTLLKLKKGGDWVGLENFREFLGGREFGHLLFNTFVWLTALSVVLRLVIGIGIAVLLNSPVLKRFNIATLAKLAILVPWATPPIVAVIVWRWMLDPQNGIINQLLLSLGVIDDPVAFLSDLRTVWPAVVTIIVWNTVPLVTLAILASLQSIPAELHEAAGLDGATRRQQFRYITLPLLRPTIIVLGLTSVFWTFNNFVYVWLATGAGPGTYTNVLATETYIRSFVDFQLGYGAAIGVVMALMMALFGVVYFWIVGNKMAGEEA
ncbi:carbohydrate ABC transporter permease [Geminicoccus roseus]|uniref:carbohydrate ABC transporter permease n=1 Tax=Geminicoccus roseus TaxID=404900 RepID=UPI0003FD2552|nr:sugar ABC transporter permease [Geminicoccus roseus]